MLKKPGKISPVPRVCHTTRYKTVGALFYLLYNKISIITSYRAVSQQSPTVTSRLATRCVIKYTCLGHACDF